jgi:hypothetical protein
VFTGLRSKGAPGEGVALVDHCRAGHLRFAITTRFSPPGYAASNPIAGYQAGTGRCAATEVAALALLVSRDRARVTDRHISVFAKVTQISNRFFRLFHIHAMRSASFCAIATNWYVCKLSASGVRATTWKRRYRFVQKILRWRFFVGASRVTLIPTIGSKLKRHIPRARGRCSKRAIGVAAIAAIPISGCANSPSIGVLGAYFPDWLFCIVTGVVLTVVIYVSLKHLQADRLMGPAALVYPTLVAFFALAVWLVLFQH